MDSKVCVGTASRRERSIIRGYARRNPPTSRTFAVVVASLVAAVLLFFIDTVAYKLMVDWLPAVWGKL